MNEEKKEETFIIKYFGKKANNIFDSVTEELTENRAFINWIYAAAYLALIFYCVVTNPQSHTIAIVTTGGLMGTIFTSFVFSKSYEKVNEMRNRSTEKPELPVDNSIEPPL